MAIQVKRETMRACLSCRLCDSILRDATTISECLHTFCRTCIYEKIREDEIKCCPVCNIDLGGAPLEKLRPDHNLQDLRAKIFPLKRRKANAPEIVSLSARRKERSTSSFTFIVSTPRVSAQAGTRGKRAKTATIKLLQCNGFLAERTVNKEESSFHEELLGNEPEDIVALSKECSFKALLVPDHLAQENRVLKHNFSVVSNSLMASNENLNKLSAEKNSADARLAQIEELKYLLAARDGELEARGKKLEVKEKELEELSLLIRAREDEVSGFRAKIENLLQERDEAVEKADRLGKELQDCKSKGRFEDECSGSEKLELEKDMELAVIAACITTRYQVCREWERQGTLGWELEFSAEDYRKFREFVDKNGTSNKYPFVEVYEEKWRKFVALHRPSESPRTREDISHPTSNSNLPLDAPDSGTNDHVEAGS